MTKSWKRFPLVVSIAFKGEDGCKLINDNTYLCVRADMRDFHLKLHQMVKTIDFLCKKDVVSYHKQMQNSTHTHYNVKWIQDQGFFSETETPSVGAFHRSFSFVY